jgi:sulfite exporter TauE/SafE
MRPHLYYNAGRVISYTAVGALLGLVGSFLAFNSQIRGYLAILAGVFMVLFGLRTFIPQLTRFTMLPGLNFHDESGFAKKGPAMIGLLSGLLPCGPLQAMLIYAAGTGSALEGALVMLAFGLGTVPLMFLLGSITAIAASSRVLINKIITFSSVLVLVLGLIMLSRGLALSGVDVSAPFSPAGLPAAKLTDYSSSNGSVNAYQEITMYANQNGWDPSVFTVKKGIPVRWTIIVNETTIMGIKAPKLGIEKTFGGSGERMTFEFTPTETGTIPFTCSMGMHVGRIDVVEG